MRRIIRRVTIIGPGKAKEQDKGLRGRPRKNPAVVEASPEKGVRINRTDLSEDEADYLYYLKHKNEKRHSLDEVMRRAGYELER